ncbi:hypothetical protein CASFOL_034506 [Castilleja foliolosa]|uniref:Uncharacterized protein n=1 Tax=Castilleja foliolosa TaxID=1961234 RepID=A0ABD3BQW5_9LAMI
MTNIIAEYKRDEILEFEKILKQQKDNHGRPVYSKLHQRSSQFSGPVLLYLGNFEFLMRRWDAKWFLHPDVVAAYDYIFS